MPDRGPPGFHLLAKPSGSTCNIDCTYCFFLSKEALYPNDKSRMSASTLEAYIRQLLESHRVPEVTVAWQGGEPTLMKLEFFQLAVELVRAVRAMRAIDLRKAPSVAETIDWARAMQALGVEELTDAVVEQTLGVVLKHEQDRQRVREQLGLGASQ